MCVDLLVPFHPQSISHAVSPEGTVEATPSISNASRGDSVEFNCSALGGPGNRFTWTRSFIQRQVANTSQLVVVVEDAFDGSEYECLVMNDAGNETATVTLNGEVALFLLLLFGTQPISTSLFLSFAVAPLILTFPEADNVTSIQDNITLTCNASGFPIPQISWTHNMTGINGSDDRVSITEDQGQRSVLSTLTVTRAMTNDSGQYECMVTSPVATYDQVLSGPVAILVQGMYTSLVNIFTILHMMEVV